MSKSCKLKWTIIIPFNLKGNYYLKYSSINTRKSGDCFSGVTVAKFYKLGALKTWTMTIPADEPMWLGEISQGPFLAEELLDINDCKGGHIILPHGEPPVGYPIQVVSSEHTYKCAPLDGINRLSLYSFIICICVCTHMCICPTAMKENEAMNVREQDGKGYKHRLYVKCKILTLYFFTVL